MAFTYRYALVRPLAHSFAQALQESPSAIPIDVAKAKLQHEAYTSAIRELVPKLIEVPVDEKFPDCCFIEDTAVVINSDIIITRIGAMSRRDEGVEVEKKFLELQILDPSLRMHYLQAPATLDGGDLLQMGGKVFVGLSKRTNQAAIDQLTVLLPGRVVSVPVAEGLHLKSTVSAIDDCTLLTSSLSATAQAIIEALPESSQKRCIEVPDAVCANIVRIGQNLLIQSGFPRSEAILLDLAKQLDLTPLRFDMSELIKADGALTCCSILVP